MFLHPPSLVKHLPVSRGNRVADVGTGTGAYAFELAKHVGTEGVVYALDRAPLSVRAVKRQAESAGLSCIAVHADVEEHIPLRDGLLHAAVAANILHALRERERFILELARVLAPQGSVLVADWASSFDGMGPPQESVVAPSEAVRLFHAAGFETGPLLPAGTHHYAFIATWALP